MSGSVLLMNLCCNGLKVAKFSFSTWLYEKVGQDKKKKRNRGGSKRDIGESLVKVDIPATCNNSATTP